MSGWTAVTVHGDDEETNEQLEEEIQAAYGGKDSFNDLPNADGYAERTIQFHRGAGATGVAERILDDLDTEPSFILVVHANDTTDSGDGTLLHVENGNVSEVETFHGYEGAKGRDVTGYFREEYDVHGYATWDA